MACRADSEHILFQDLDSELLIPYSFGHDADLDSHFYNIKITGDLLLARFAWFHMPMEGYAMMKIESEDQLTGGWWISSHRSLQGKDLSSFSMREPTEMNPITLV
jgi:hypothetical protein